MANTPRSSRKKEGRVCVTCRKIKSEQEFPLSTSETCISCGQGDGFVPEAAPVKRAKSVKGAKITEVSHPQASSGVSPPADVADEVVDEAPFVPTHPELDYSNPTLQELAARTLARRKLLRFIQRFRPKYLPGWVHEDICRRLERFMKDVEDQKEPRLLLMMPVRHGKQLAHGTPMLTTEGWSTHGALKPGDHVFGPDGLPTAVIAISEETPSDVMVTFTDGSKILCHENHEWTVYQRSHSRWITVPTLFWLEPGRFGKRRQLKSGSRYIYKLPHVAPVQFDNRILGNKEAVFVTSVERVVSTERGRCIQVARSDGLYLAGKNLVPTHNSEISSRHFAPFVLGHHPDWEIIAASGASSLALSFSRYIRDLVRSDSYKALFPEMALDPSSQSVENWNTTKGGGYLAAGIGTMITGRGAHILVIDDPVKDAEAADSAVIRDATWEWYMSTALSRLAPGGGVLGILTWWNEDDWAGRVQQLSEMEDADRFEIVKYPAINDQGDEYILVDDRIEQFPPGSTIPEGATMTRPMNTALHPARYTLASLLKRKATYFGLGQQRWWHALYQQSPTVDDGVFFTKKMFRHYVTDPHPLERSTYQTWDFAITEGQQNDFTVGATGHVDERNNLHVADLVRFKSDDSFVIADAILDNWVAHGSCAQIGFEDGQIWKAVSAVFLRRCEERGLFPSYELLVPLSDKAARAQPLRGLMQGGKVWFKDKATWWEQCSKELTQFLSGGKHDDIVDACFIAGTKVTMRDGSQANIEWLAEGDWVDTPYGPRLVLDAECTCNEAVVYEVELSDGRILTGTSEHPVSTQRGWIPLANLTTSDIIHVRASVDKGLSSCQEFTRKQQQTSTGLSSTESSIEGIQIHQGNTWLGITRVQEGEDFFTAMFGRFTTALYQKAVSFITRMKIISTTIFRILSVCRVSITLNTCTQNKLRTADRKNNATTSLIFEQRLLSGTNQKKGVSGTRLMRKMRGWIESLYIASVSAAGSFSEPCLTTPSIAASVARTKIGTLTTLTMVRRNVLAQRHVVYNLTVAEAECYYANGVLVHNCAWLARLALKHSAPKKAEPKPVKSWKDKLFGFLKGDTSHMAA